MRAAAHHVEGTPSSPIVRPLPGTSRYELVAKIAAGGMAMVYVGKLRGAAGFWRLCAIKRAHPHLVEDPELRRSLVAEARLASRIHHPNVVAVSDVEELEGELLLVMDYVEGAALSDLFRLAEAEQRRLSARAVIRIGLDAAAGLGAAHALRDDSGAPLGLVHRDVSPQNVLVGADGIARIVDFGIAKCRDVGESQLTTTGALKGKVAYMSPEYIRGRAIDARSDVFGLGVVLWEALAGVRLFRAETELDTMTNVTSAPAPPLSSVVPELVPLDAVLARALEKSPARRFGGMQELANALSDAASATGLTGSATEVAAEVEMLAGQALEQRRALVRSRMAVPSAPESSPPDSARLVPESVGSRFTHTVTMSDARATLPVISTSAHGAQAGGTFVLHARKPRPSSAWRVVLGMVGVTAVVVGAAVLWSRPVPEPATGIEATPASASVEPTDAPAASLPAEPSATAAPASPEPAPTPSATAAASTERDGNNPSTPKPATRPPTRGPRRGGRDTPDPNPYPGR